MTNLLTAAVLAVIMLQQRAPTPASPPASTPSATAHVEDPAITALALKIYAQMRVGKVDSSLLSTQMNEALTPAVLTQQKPVFDQLGDPTGLTFEKSQKLPQGTRHEYLATFPTAQFHVSILIDNDGKVAGYFLAP